MSKIGLLIKTYFLVFLGNLKSNKNAKSIGGGLLVTLISLLMIASFTFTAYSTTKQFVDLSETLPKAYEMAMFSNLIIGLLLIILFTIMRSIYPSKTRDQDMLLGLPFSKSQIILSKAIYNYIFDVISYGMVLLPSFICYYILVPNTNFLIVIWGVVFVLLAALLSSGISYIISLLFVKLASKLKNFNIIQSIITLLMLAGYIILQYSIPGYLSEFTGDPTEYINSIGIMKFLLSWILHNNLRVLLIITLICLIVYGISFGLRVYYFGKNFKEYQNKNQIRRYQVAPVWMSLFKKEIKAYFGDTAYFINTIIGCFFVIGISIAYRIIDSEQVLVFIHALPKELHVSPDILIVILSSMLLSTTVTSSVALSLEGNSFWILKAHPIKERDIFLSKILVNVLLVSITAFISAFLFAEYSKPLTLVVYFLIPLLSGINNSIIGILVNLIYPKFDFESSEQVVKRSLSHPLAMFVSFIISIIPGIIYFVYGKTWTLGIYFLVALGINGLIMILLISILMTKGVKIFRKL